jgi:hypothetical protein
MIRRASVVPKRSGACSIARISPGARKWYASLKKEMLQKEQARIIAQHQRSSIR